MKKANLIAVLTVGFSDSRTAKAIDDALIADNINLPLGMDIKQRQKGNTLQIKVNLKKVKQIDTLISTLDEFVSHIQASFETLSSVRSSGVFFSCLGSR